MRDAPSRRARSGAGLGGRLHGLGEDRVNGGPGGLDLGREVVLQALAERPEERRGERLAAVTWVQSYVRDPARREFLHDVYQMREKLAELHPDDEETDFAFKTYANLLRMWSE